MGRVAGLVSLVAACGLLCAAGGPKAPGPDLAFKRFVLFPYAGAVDEAVYHDMKLGTFPRVWMPEWARFKNYRLEFHETFAGRANPGPAVAGRWREAGDEVPGLFAADVFGKAVVYVEDLGSYFVREDVYERYRGRTAVTHQGRLEFFVKGSVKLNEYDPKNPDHHTLLVWDDTDTCWRYPATLIRVEPGYLIPEVGPPPDPARQKANNAAAGATTGVIVDLLDRWAVGKAAGR